MITNAQLLEMQDSTELITQTETIGRVRKRGHSLSPRRVGSWQESQLIPPADRVGARGGVYPALVVQLLSWICTCRELGFKIEVIRELGPLWANLTRAQLRQEVHLLDVEYLARSLGLSREANNHVPWLVNYIMSGLCPDCLSGVKWVLKDGSVVQHTEHEGLKLHFVIGEIDPESGHAHVVAWTQLTLPGIGHAPNLTDPALIILGLPNGIALGHSCDHTESARRHRPQRPPKCRTPKISMEEQALFT
jgi:DNA-binding transcriptional MerR regulator